MKTSLLFFGGCTGIGKSVLLNEALKRYVDEEYCVIKISEYFNNIHQKFSSENDKNKDIIWHKDPWKKYEESVLDDITGIISSKERVLVIINQHFATISPAGYLPGIDMDSLDKLLLQHLNLITSQGGSNLAKNKKTQNNDLDQRYNFGILLIDTNPRVMRDYYDRLLSDGFIFNHVLKCLSDNKITIDNLNLEKIRKVVGDDYARARSILGYVSNDNIIKDLEENRRWAAIYGARARSILEKDDVFCQTIYIDDLTKNEEIIKKIEGFIGGFGLTKNKGASI